MGHVDAPCQDELQFYVIHTEPLDIGTTWTFRWTDSWSCTSYVPTFPKVVPGDCSSLSVALSITVLEWMHEQFVNRNESIDRYLLGISILK